MKKIVLGKCEVRTESLIMGAVAVTGIGLIALGVKSFFDAKKIKGLEEEPFDDEVEFEEYKLRKAMTLSKKRSSKIRTGIAASFVGLLAAVVGVSAFTPLKKIIVNEDFTLKADKAEKLDGAIKTVKDFGGSFQDSVQELKRIKELRTELKSKVDKAKQLTDKLESVLERIA